MNASLPLSGVRVIELGTVIAGPFAGALLADLGAEVIKIEPPGKGDMQRGAGHIKNGLGLWWGVASRDKKCITLDLKHPEGKTILRQLARKADVLIENYRPGTLERLGFGWEALHGLNPRLVMLSISGYGASGPSASRPGFGKIAEGYSGLVTLTGNAHERPLFIGFSLADTTTGLFGALGVLLALFHRDAQGGAGSLVDMALYEGLFRMLDCQLAVQANTGQAVARQGTNDGYGWGLRSATRPMFQGVKSCTGEWFLLRISDPARALRLVADSGASGNLRDLLEAYAATREPEVLRGAMIGAGIDIVPVLDGATMAASEYMKARGDVLPASHPKAGDFAVPGYIYPKASQGDARRNFHDAGLGEHTDEVLKNDLGYALAEIGRLRAQGVV